VISINFLSAKVCSFLTAFLSKIRIRSFSMLQFVFIPFNPGNQRKQGLKFN
jgi:hypothetical protein